MTFAPSNASAMFNGVVVFEDFAATGSTDGYATLATPSGELVSVGRISLRRGAPNGGLSNASRGAIARHVL